MAETVFYSWQSDLPNRCNRGFIQRALKQALADLERDADLEVAPRLDQDTSGVPGSPDISEVIFEKIDSASVFVADVTLLPNHDGRAVPNPNVLIELGYALKALGPRRVVMVVNTHFGVIEGLPFDLRRKRVLSYSLDPGAAAAAEERRALRTKFKNALRLIFQGERQAARQQRYGNYVSELVTKLISFLLFAEQMEDRHLNPWFGTAQYTFRAQAEGFRELAVQPEAEELEVAEELRSLARRIDVVTQHVSALGREDWQEYLGKVSSAVEAAASLKSDRLGLGGLNSESAGAALAVLAQSQRVLASLRTEAQEAITAEGYPPQWERIRDRASEEGEKLLRLTYYPLPTDTVDVEKLRPIAKALHQLELLEQRTTGRDTIDKCLESVLTLGDQLSELASTRS